MQRNRMAKWAGVFTLIVILMWPVGGTLLAANGITINLRLPETAWSDSRLGERLDMFLSDINRVPITRFGPFENIAPVGVASSFEELLEFGRRQGDRFLVDITIDRIDLEQRKTTIFPCLFFRYRTYAVITGKLRVLDITRERMISHKDIDYEIKASDQWQAMDDNPYDPALHIPTDEKIILFAKLEDEAASRLYKEIKKLIKGNSFGR
jgi:hypothetical protein